MLRGTLERVPRTPQNFSQNWRGWGGGAERGLAPGGGRAPARHLFALPPRCLVGGRGGFGRPPALPLVFFPAPIPPPALAERSSRREGGDYKFISPGASPPAPRALNRLRHLQSLPSRYPEGRPRAALGNGGEPRAQRGVCLRRRQFGAKPTGSGSLRAVPPAKERGDRGRGTSAFEMVLSPGAGRASAARGKLLAGHHSGRNSQCRAGSAPCGHHSGRNSQCRAGSAPLWAPQRQG